jgi:hypothetical protein
MKSLVRILAATLCLASTAKGQVFSGTISGWDVGHGYFPSDSQLGLSYQYVSDATGTFASLTEDNTVNTGFYGFASSEFTVNNFSPLTLSSVNPSTPANDYITILGGYDFNVTSISVTDVLVFGDTVPNYVLSGNITDTSGVLPAAPAYLEIDPETPPSNDNGHAHYSFNFEVGAVPEPPITCLLAGGMLLGLLARRFFMRVA